MATPAASMKTTSDKTTSNTKTAQDATAFALGLTPDIYNLFRMGEELAHKIAYHPIQTNSTLYVYIGELNRKLKHFVYQLQVDNPGLVGYILCPTVLSKELKDKIDIKILFKGTSDLPSLLRDIIEHGGAGNESFHANKKTMIAQINKVLKYYKAELTSKGIVLNQLEFSITIAGHSLGAADAQRLLFALKEAIAQNLGCPNIEDGVIATERDQLNDIIKLRLFTFNSTGASTTDNQQAEAVSGWITSKRNEPNSKFKLTTEVNIFYADGDGVQQSGDTHLLYRVSKEQALIRFVKASNKYKGQNYITQSEAFNTLIKVTSKIAINNMSNISIRNVALMGVVAGLGIYTCGLSNLVSGGLAALAGGLLQWRDYLESFNMLYSLAAGGYGSLITHRAYYFNLEHHELASNRPLDHMFTLYTNERPEEHELIKAQIQLKSGAANTVAKGISFTHGLLRCRRSPSNKTKTQPGTSIPQGSAANSSSSFSSGASSSTTGFASSSSSSSSASPTAGGTPLTWHLKLDADNLKKHQSEKETEKSAAVMAEYRLQQEILYKKVIQDF